MSDEITNEIDFDKQIVRIYRNGKEITTEAITDMVDFAIKHTDYSGLACPVETEVDGKGR